MDPRPGGHARYVAIIGPRDAGAELCELARSVGREVARRRAVVLCGGLGGVMAAAARGAREADPRGTTIGILPGTDRRAANQFLDYVLPTGLEEIRDAALVSSADAVIAVGGNPGTLIEIGYALLRGRPLAVLAGWSLRDASNAPVPGLTVAGTPEAAVAAVLGPDG